MSFNTYLKNIEEKTGHNPEDFVKLAIEKGFTLQAIIQKQITATQIINWLKDDFNLGHGHTTAIYAYIKGKRS